MKNCIKALEHNYNYKVSCLCEPQFGKRGLYPDISKKGSSAVVRTMSDFVAYADGRNDLIQISELIGAPIDELIPIVDMLLENKLIEKL